MRMKSHHNAAEHRSHSHKSVSGLEHVFGSGRRLDLLAASSFAVSSLFPLSLAASSLALSTVAYGASVQAAPDMMPSSAPIQCDWTDWQRFQSQYVSEEGRVIDGSDPRRITTSEGQAYALFFALVANDQKAFERIYEWTRVHLANGDLTAQLPAWLWGNSPQGYRVLDANSAADSDLWLAYTLLEAGRVWQNSYFSNVGYFLAKRIEKALIYDAHSSGYQLLPAATGFTQERTITLNPSYVPMFILHQMAALQPSKAWQLLQTGSQDLLLASQKQGVSPDWVQWSQGQFFYQGKQGDVGSYNAIRTYLWVGMMPKQMAGQTALLQSLQPFVGKVKKHGVPEKTYAKTGKVSGQGPIGFHAALIPFMQAQGEPTLAEQFYQQTQAQLVTQGNRHYYGNVLGLFGKGWYEHRYRFNPVGQVSFAWQTGTCQP